MIMSKYYLLTHLFYYSYNNITVMYVSFALKLIFFCTDWLTYAPKKSKCSIVHDCSNNMFPRKKSHQQRCKTSISPKLIRPPKWLKTRKHE